MYVYGETDSILADSAASRPLKKRNRDEDIAISVQPPEKAESPPSNQPRSIAGSKRTAQALNTPSPSQSSISDDLSPTLNYLLPTTTSELGSLPIYGQFNFLDFINSPVNQNIMPNPNSSAIGINGQSFHHGFDMSGRSIPIQPFPQSLPVYGQSAPLQDFSHPTVIIRFNNTYSICANYYSSSLTCLTTIHFSAWNQLMRHLHNCTLGWTPIWLLFGPLHLPTCRKLWVDGLLATFWKGLESKIGPLTSQIPLIRWRHKRS